MEGYLSDSDILKIKSNLNKRLTNFFGYKLIYTDNLVILAFAVLEFEYHSKLIFSTGQLAENIVVLDFEEMDNQINKYKNQSNVLIEEVDLLLSFFSNARNNNLIHFEVIDQKGFCHNLIRLVFEETVIHILGGADELIIN